MIEKILPMNLWWKWMYWRPIFIGMLDCPESALMKRKTDMLKGLIYYAKKERPRRDER